MADFHFTVDTREMAQSIDGVSSGVGGVTVAVVAMQAAVVAAEEMAARQICVSVDRGIFSLIQSQISQKIARSRSIVDSRVLEMRQQSQSLAGIRARMERDYQMIANRYTKVFQSIDASLRNRVFELDKAVSVLVHREMEQIANRAQSVQAHVPMHQMESVVSAQVIAAAQTKEKARRGIESMQAFLTASQYQSRLLKSVLRDQSGVGATVRHLPVLLVEQDGLSVKAPQWGVRFAPYPGATARDQAIQRGALAALPSLQWQRAGTPVRVAVGASYRQLLDRAKFDERVKRQMAALFDAASWSELQETRQ
jgi:hypothetical protein